MALSDDLQLITFREVVNDSVEYRLRFLYRWYSKTFSTPLHLVPSIPFTDVLQAFWEERYEKMEPEDLEDERKLLLETDEDRSARLVAEDKDKVELEQLVEDLKMTPTTKKLPDVTVAGPVKTRTKIPEPELPDGRVLKKASESLPENIEIKFTPTDFFNELVDRLDGVGTDDDEQS